MVLSSKAMPNQANLSFCPAQKTIKEKVCARGVGLHSGQTIQMELLPAGVGHGICFVRTDLPDFPEISAHISNLGDTRLQTTLRTSHPGGAAQISTVEHLLSALAALGITNLRILVDGPEVPIFDGSSLPFVALLDRAGIEAQQRARHVLVIRREVSVQAGDKSARVVPSQEFKITSRLDFDHPLISNLPLSMCVTPALFRKNIAAARTFGFLHEVEALKAAGLARGGSLKNAVVIDGYTVRNPEGLRFVNEFARHKILDAIGDLSLIGYPLLGHVHLYKSGHALNTDLVSKTLSDPKNYQIVALNLDATAPESLRASRACPKACIDVASSIA